MKFTLLTIVGASLLGLLLSSCSFQQSPFGDTRATAAEVTSLKGKPCTPT